MKYLFSAFLLLAFAVGAFAQTATTAASVTEFDVAGLKVIVKRRTGSPTVSAGLITRGGVRNQTEKNAGIENLTWSVATEASKKYPREILRKELARTGTAIVGTAGYDFGGLSMISTSQNFARSWDIFTDIALNPTFDPADVGRVRDGVLAALRNRNSSPDSALATLEDKIVYASHPYANGPAGTLESVAGLTAADLLAFQKKMMQSSRLLLVIVGDVDVATVKNLVTASFASLPKGDYKEAPLPAIAFDKPTLDTVTRSLNTNYVKGVFAAPSLASPDYYAMRVAIVILHGRIVQEVRTRRNLSYAPAAEMGNHAANSANIYVTSVDANQSVDVMLKEIANLRSTPLSDDEFVGVPGFFLTTYYIDQEANSAQAAELARYELVGGGWRRSFDFLERCSKVTAAEIQAVANKYMKNVRFVVIGDPKQIDRQIFLGN